MEEIDFAGIEKKWQDKWAASKIFEANDKSKKPKFYVLEMFPYPSGSGLHMGHALNYVIGDVYVRYKKMKGFEVLHPMGFDALGLPAENAAIKDGTHPEDYTNASIKNYISQQKNLGISYDWTRVVNTASPDYYKWDQWIFLKMLEKGLAYQKTSAVNWCSECDTVLANEQVTDGKCWRHEDTDVEVRHLKQWFFKTTEYADELYENLDNMNWPERTKAMQRNWIGKSHGTEIDFVVETPRRGTEIGIPNLAQARRDTDRCEDVWKIFTTRPDTIFGVTFMVVSAQHPRLDSLVTKEQKKEVEAFLKKIGSVSQKAMKDVEELDKEGVFSGSYAVNPANGERVPIWVGNFVVADYGAGMVMAVPAHDSRDFEFAKKYGISIRQVVEEKIPAREDGLNSSTNNISLEEDLEKAYTGNGTLYKSGEFNYLDSVEAKSKITTWLEKKGVGRKVVNFKLRDWGISRQRYWGTPIPIIHCEKCGAVPVPEKDLPVKLPKDVKFGKGNPLESAEKWLNVKCPKCGGKGRRESDTMDTFVNSSWYFLRYCDAHNDKNIFDVKKVKEWCPVDFYIGGAEHACMHLIYSRFYVKFLRDLGLIDFDEPAVRLFHQGMLHGEGGIKMSKSKGNVINPDDVSKRYGIDTARYFLLNLAEPDKKRDWSEAGIAGSARFMKKVIGFFDEIKIGKGSSDFDSVIDEAVLFVEKNIKEVTYRKATIKIKEVFENIVLEKTMNKESVEKFLKILAPFCPHVAEELWEKIGNKEMISVASWPEVKVSKVKKEGVDLTGKVISEVEDVATKFGDKETLYLYAMPFEVSKVDIEKISKKFGKNVKIFAVNDKGKYDPEGKAKKAKPGKVSFYFE